MLGLGSAKEGSALVRTAAGAIALAILGIWFFVALAGLGGDLDRVRTWLSAPLTTTLLLVMIGTLARHTILGLQVVIEDYVGSRVCGLHC